MAVRPIKRLLMRLVATSTGSCTTSTAIEVNVSRPLAYHTCRIRFVSISRFSFSLSFSLFFLSFSLSQTFSIDFVLSCSTKTQSSLDVRCSSKGRHCKCSASRMLNWIISSVTLKGFSYPSTRTKLFRVGTLCKQCPRNCDNGLCSPFTENILSR